MIEDNYINDPENFGRINQDSSNFAPFLYKQKITPTHECFSFRKNNNIDSLILFFEIDGKPAGWKSSNFSMKNFKTNIIPISELMYPVGEFHPRCSHILFIEFSNHKKLKSNTRNWKRLIQSIIEHFNEEYQKNSKTKFPDDSQLPTQTTNNSHNGKSALEAIKLYKKDHAISPRHGLKEKEITGLYGELFFIKQLVLIYDYNWKQALSYWKGCSSEQQDFQNPEWVIEVKSTRTDNSPDHIWINGINQLSLPVNRILFLVHYHFEKTGSNSLLTIIDDIENLLISNDLKLDFQSKLKEAGYDPIHNNDYDEITFSSPDTSLYEICEKFPKITKENIPNSDFILDVKYKIKINELSGFIKSDKFFKYSIMSTHKI